MPSISQRRNAATAVAVVLALLLAVVWLRSADGPAPAVPAGLTPTAPPATATQPTLGLRGGRRAKDRSRGERHGRGERRDVRAGREADGGGADRAGGAEDARAPCGARCARARRRQDPPAAAPGLGAERGGARSGGAAAGTGAGASERAPSAPAAPEFAIG